MNAPLIQGIRYSIYQVRKSLDLLAILPLLFITTCVSGQTPSSDVSPPLIRVSSQLVLIDALVEDGKTGNP